MDAKRVKEVQQIAKDLKNNLSSLLEIQSQAMEQIPQSYANITDQAKRDVIEVSKHVENQDFASLNALYKRYANNNPK